MKQPLPSIMLALLFWGLGLGLATAQSNKPYTDHQPEYRTWQDIYIIDRIQHTRERTIIHIRIAAQDIIYSSAIFYPRGDENAWYLKDSTGSETIQLKEIRNIRRNGKLVKDRVTTEHFSIAGTGAQDHVIYSCEIHFERLPAELEVVDLIEGVGKEYNISNFNFFNIKIKPRDAKDLGRRRDSKRTAQAFEERFPPQTKPSPATGS